MQPQPEERYNKGHLDYPEKIYPGSFPEIKDSEINKIADALAGKATTEWKSIGELDWANTKALHDLRSSGKRVETVYYKNRGWTISTMLLGQKKTHFSYTEHDHKDKAHENSILGAIRAALQRCGIEVRDYSADNPTYAGRIDGLQIRKPPEQIIDSKLVKVLAATQAAASTVVDGRTEKIDNKLSELLKGSLSIEELDQEERSNLRADAAKLFNLQIPPSIKAPTESNEQEVRKFVEDITQQYDSAMGLLQDVDLYKPKNPKPNDVPAPTQYKVLKLLNEHITPKVLKRIGNMQQPTLQIVPVTSTKSFFKAYNKHKEKFKNKPKEKQAKAWGFPELNVEEIKIPWLTYQRPDETEHIKDWEITIIEGVDTLESQRDRDNKHRNSRFLTSGFLGTNARSYLLLRMQAGLDNRVIDKDKAATVLDGEPPLVGRIGKRNYIAQCREDNESLKVRIETEETGIIRIPSAKRDAFTIRTNWADRQTKDSDTNKKEVANIAAEVSKGKPEDSLEKLAQDLTETPAKAIELMDAVRRHVAEKLDLEVNEKTINFVDQIIERQYQEAAGFGKKISFHQPHEDDAELPSTREVTTVLQQKLTSEQFYTLSKMTQPQLVLIPKTSFQRIVAPFKKGDLDEMYTPPTPPLIGETRDENITETGINGGLFLDDVLLEDTHVPQESTTPITGWQVAIVDASINPVQGYNDREGFKSCDVFQYIAMQAIKLNSHTESLVDETIENRTATILIEPNDKGIVLCGEGTIGCDNEWRTTPSESIKKNDSPGFIHKGVHVRRRGEKSGSTTHSKAQTNTPHKLVYRATLTFDLPQNQ